MNKKLRLLALIVLMGLLSVVCSRPQSQGPEGGTTVSADQGGVVTSEDGLLSLDIPAGALEADTAIQISPVPVEELPEGSQTMEGLEAAYRLEPDGLQFKQPVSVRLDLNGGSLLEENGKVSSPAYLLLTQAEEGAIESLENLEMAVSLDAGTGSIVGQLTHFSFIYKVDSGVRVGLERLEPAYFVTDELRARVRVAAGVISSTAGVSDVNITSILSTATGKVTVFTDAEELDGPVTLKQLEFIEEVGTYLCGLEPGQGTYGTLVQGSIPQAEGEKPVPIRIAISAPVQCVVATATPSPTPPPTYTPEPTPEPVETEETRIGAVWEDSLNDAILCQSGESYSGPTPPEIDIGMVAVEWLDKDYLLMGITFPRVEILDRAIVGSIEFDDPSVPNSSPSDTWYFSGRGEVDGNYYFDPPNLITTEAYTYFPDQGWVENTGHAITATIQGNQLNLIVPADDIPYLERPIKDDLRVWTGVTTPTYEICDAALLDENGTAFGQVPPRPEE